MGKRNGEKRQKKSVFDDEPPVKRIKDEVELPAIVSSDQTPSKKV